MDKTVGSIDRVGRLVLAAGAVAGAGVLGFSTAWGILLLLAAVVMLATSASATCPIYSALGVDTRAGLPRPTREPHAHGA